jgi:hypothetical protein
MNIDFEELFFGGIALFFSLIAIFGFRKSKKERNTQKEKELALKSEQEEREREKEKERQRIMKKSNGEPLVGDRDLRIGDMIVSDPETATKHFLIAATIGAGKSQTLHTMFDRVFWGVDNRPSSEKAIITDPSGEFLSSRGQESDKILNPYDKTRTLNWSPFNEIFEESDWDMVARAVMPDSPSHTKQEWVEYGRAFLIDIMKSLHRVGNHNVREVARLVNQAEAEELIDHLSGTPSELLVKPGGENLLKSVRFEALSGIRNWSALQPNGDFSIRKWVMEGRGSIFITYNDSQVDSMIPLIRAWLSLGIRQTLSLEPDFDRRVWFVMDELDSLGRVDFLPQALSRGRKYGLAAIGICQSLPQFDVNYGHDQAKVLRSVFVNKLIMQQGSAYDAEEWSREIGEFYKKETNLSTGTGPSGQTSGTTTSTQIRRLVTGTELMNLPPGFGYGLVKTKPGCLEADVHNRVPCFRVKFRGYEKKIKPFISQKE